MAAQEISLDDIGRTAKTTAQPKARPKLKVKAKSTAKPAKPAKKVVVAKKVKKKTVKKESKTAMPKQLPASGVPSDSLPALEAQMGEILESLPDAIKQENDQIEEYMTMFNTCRQLARNAEEIYFEKRQSRDLYPIMQVYNQMRDIIADLRALRDVGQMGEILNEEVVSPLVQANAAELVTLRQVMAQWFKSNLPPEKIKEANEALNANVTKAARSMQESYGTALNKTIQVFNGGM